QARAGGPSRLCAGRRRRRRRPPCRPAGRCRRRRGRATASARSRAGPRARAAARRRARPARAGSRALRPAARRSGKPRSRPRHPAAAARASARPSLIDYEAVRRRLIAVCLVAGAALVLVAAASAGNGGFAPETPHSPNASRINDSHKLIALFTGLILILVEAALITFVVRYRRRGRPRDAEGPQDRG